MTFFSPPIPVFILDFSFRPNLVFPGWSEPAATSAPVHDQAIQAILGIEPKTHPPLPKVFSFFCPKVFFSYLPPPSHHAHLILHSFHVFEKRKKMAVASVTFFNDFVTKKKGHDNCFRLFSFFFLWFSWSSSLELTINNEMVVFFFNVEGCNG